jgi:protein gp37
MGETTKIEWADHTFNPWIGCTKVSEACRACYAERFGARKGVKWGAGQPRKRTAASTWEQPRSWNRMAHLGADHWDQDGPDDDPAPRPRVFCASLADWLDAEVPVEWLRDLLGLIGATSGLDWLLLTKRPELFETRMRAVADLPCEHTQDGGDRCGVIFARLWLMAMRGEVAPPANVWAGTTVETQACANERIPRLVRIPARVHFLSCEPLLEAIDLRPWLAEEAWWCPAGHGVELGEAAWTGSLVPTPDSRAVCSEHGTDLVPACGPQVDWVIGGGESGDRRDIRPTHPAWARSLRDQAHRAGVPFLWKQWGEWQACSAHPRDPKHERIMLNDGRLVGLHEDLTPYDAGGKWGSFDPNVMARVGKASAGRELDGRTWDEFPRVPT